MLLGRSFYTRDNVVQIARELLGKTLFTCFDGVKTAAIITETEAYAGITDKASHAYNNRRTARTEIMYREGGTAYVYLCYGIHSLFNVVTSVEGNPHAVLIRSIEPIEGIEWMKQRVNKSFITYKQGIGPGNVSKLLGIHFSHTGTNLCKNKEDNSIWIEDTGLLIPDTAIKIGPRVGVYYAGNDAQLPYRFICGISTKNKEAALEQLLYHK